MSGRLQWCDGRVVEDATPVYDAFHPGPRLGEAVFESFRVTACGVVAFDRHLSRLRWAAGRLGVLPLPEHDWPVVLAGLLARSGLTEARGRLTLHPPGNEPRVVLSLEPMPEDHARRVAEGVAVATSPYRPGPQDPTRALKLASRAFWRMAEAEARARGAVEALIVGEGGEVRETGRANLFCWRDGEGLLTPTLTDAFLPGVTRARLLEAARAAGLPVKERTILRPELDEAAEILLTNAVYGIYPVRRLDGRDLRPGPILARCLQLLGP